MMVLGVDCGTDAGFALYDGTWREVVQITGAADQVAWLRARTEVLQTARIVIERPEYAASRAKGHQRQEVLPIMAGVVQGALLYAGLPFEEVSWRKWRAAVDDGRTGPAEDRALGYALEVLRVPPGLLMGSKGGVLKDAATACCIAHYGFNHTGAKP